MEAVFMKRKLTVFFMAALSAVFLLLAGCGGSRYLVVTEDYNTYVTATKPEVGSDGSTLMFEDEKGREVTLPHDKVKEMRRLD